FFGAAFMVLVPVLLTNVPHMFGMSLAVDTASHIEHMVFGSLIVFFLIVEPHGLARLWSMGKEKLGIWPFPHSLFHGSPSVSGLARVGYAESQPVQMDTIGRTWG